MKSIILFVSAMALSVTAFGSATPDEKLVERFLKVTRQEQQITAANETYIQQLTADADPAAKAQIERYFNEVMGWGAVKKQLAKIISETYSTQELKAYIAFAQSPTGQSFAIKEITASKLMATLISDNMRRFSKQGTTSNAQQEDRAQTLSIDDIVSSEVEEQNVEGRIYFTGKIENHGSKARRGLQVEVDLFQGGKFVDQYSTYVSGILAPGATRYFKISCGCKDSPPAKHDSFKVRVIEGY